MNHKLILFKAITTFLISLLIASCIVDWGGESGVVGNDPPEKPSLNVMILLDLSDRLIKQEGQPSRDKELLGHICAEMPNIIRDNNGIDKSKEIIKIQIADQDNIPYSSNRYSDSLYFKMSRDVRGGYPAVKKILGDRFTRNLDQLYQSAVFSDKAEDYAGANISRYFIRDLKNDIKRDTMTYNLMFIFTDGYVVVGEENNAMLDPHNQFPELKVMVLEIAPKNQDYESERIQKSWDSWFAQMKIQGYTLRSNNTPLASIKNDIEKFLKGELELTVPGKDSGVEPIPIAITKSAGNITQTNATLNGSVNPNGQKTSVIFEYGTTNRYGNKITAINSPYSGKSNTQVSAKLSGLKQKTTYHFRVNATSAIGTATGSDQTFITLENEIGTASGSDQTFTTLENERGLDVYQGTVTFSNGDVYVGELINKIPNGWGKKTYKNATQISENDIHKQRVDAGDYLEGIWKDGEFTSGKRYDSTGKYIKTIIIGSD